MSVGLLPSSPNTLLELLHKQAINNTNIKLPVLGHNCRESFTAMARTTRNNEMCVAVFMGFLSL